MWLEVPQEPTNDILPQAVQSNEEQFQLNNYIKGFKRAIPPEYSRKYLHDLQIFEQESIFQELYPARYQMLCGRASEVSGYICLGIIPHVKVDECQGTKVYEEQWPKTKSEKGRDIEIERKHQIQVHFWQERFGGPRSFGGLDSWVGDRPCHAA